jgi:hypothetical protein
MVFVSSFTVIYLVDLFCNANFFIYSIISPNSFRTAISKGFRAYSTFICFTQHLHHICFRIRMCCWRLLMFVLLLHDVSSSSEFIHLYSSSIDIIIASSKRWSSGCALALHPGGGKFEPRSYRPRQS